MTWRDAAKTVLTLLAVTAGAVYIVARATTLGSGWLLAISVPLYLAEVVALGQFSLFAFVAWHRQGQSRNRRPASPVTSSPSAAEADVVIDVRYADVDALERTLVGVESLPARKTIIIDGRQREEIAETVRSFGASLVVDDRANDDWIDVFLDASQSDLVAWLEAGQVPAPDFLDAGCARLTDRSLAVWQSAIGMLNVDSFAHIQRGRDEDAVLRTVVAPGLDSLGAAPWFGPGSVIRRQALELLGSVRGVPEAATQEWLTRLHRAGWNSAFDEVPRVRAIAPDDLDGYLVARRDRTTAGLAVFTTRRNPLFRRGLTLQHRIAHLTMASMFVTGIRQLTVVIVLIATLLTGRLPFDGPLRSILILWAIATATSTLSRRVLAAGSMKIGDWSRHGWRTLGADLAGIMALFARRTDSRSSKRASATGLRTLGRLRVLTGVVIALDLALLLRGATIAFQTALPAFDSSERLVVITFGLFTLVPIVDVLQLVVSRKQRRKTFRLPAELDVIVGGTPAKTIDLALSGVGVLLAFSPEIGSQLQLRLMLPGPDGQLNEVEVVAAVRAASLDPSGLVRVGLEFGQLSAPARRNLIAYCMLDGSRRRQPDELAEPHLLTIERPAEHRVHPLRALTAISAMASIGFLFLGPSAASAAETATEVYTIRVLDTTGAAVSGPHIRVYSEESMSWQDVGEIPESGQLQFTTSAVDDRALDTRVEVVWAGSRLVLPARSREISIDMARLDPGDARVIEIDTGSGWVPFRVQTEALPGPVALRLADDSVLKVTLQPAHALDISTGEQAVIELNAPTTTTTTSEAPSTSVSPTTASSTPPEEQTTSSSTTTGERSTTTEAVGAS